MPNHCLCPFYMQPFLNHLSIGVLILQGLRWLHAIYCAPVSFWIGWRGAFLRIIAVALTKTNAVSLWNVSDKEWKIVVMIEVSLPSLWCIAKFSRLNCYKLCIAITQWFVLLRPPRFKWQRLSLFLIVIDCFLINMKLFKLRNLF